MSRTTAQNIVSPTPQQKQDQNQSTFSMVRQGGVLTIRFGGPRVGEREATIVSPQVRAAIAAIGGNLKGVLLDMSQVRVMSSFGLGLCIELRNVAATQRANTVLYGMTSDIRELFRVMKVDRLFTIALNSKPAAK